MKKVALSEVKDDFSRFLRIAESEEIVITRHGKAAGVLVGFESEDDWFDYRLENDPRFTERIASARASLDAGRGIRVEDVKETAPNRKPSTGRAKATQGRAKAGKGRLKSPESR